MSEKVAPESPHTQVAYAGFPVSPNGGIGLWCPRCGRSANVVEHNPDGSVDVVHANKTPPLYWVKRCRVQCAKVVTVDDG